MTDRINGCVVVFHDPIREDDAASTIECIRQLRNVMSVEVIKDDPGTQVAHARARNDIMAAIYSELKKW
jgi:acyl-coenzyme A thioesterase PaaI-like protein